MKSANSSINLKVTSVWYENADKVVFGAMAADDEGRNVAVFKYYVVHAPKRHIPFPIKRMQIWKVTGHYTDRSVVKNNIPQTEVNITASKLNMILPKNVNAFMGLIVNDNSFEGIGERLAFKLWMKFRKRIYSILENGSINELLETKGLGLKGAVSLIQGWNKYRNLRHIAWFDKYDIPSGIAMQLIKHHKGKSIQAIEEDPYRLMSFGLSFDEADQVAKQSFGFKDNSPKRLLAVVALAQKKRMLDGHTISNHSNLLLIISETLGEELAAQALRLEHSNFSFFVSSNGIYHSMAAWTMECVIAKRLASLSLRETWTPSYEEALSKTIYNLPFSMTERQVEAVTTSFSRGASVVSGGAGTGKTTILKVVFECYLALGAEVKPMALSGRAAQRITELTGFPAQTIAAFLKQDPICSTSRTVLVIDEASMLDLPTMFKLVTHVPPMTRFILVGDPAQLCPIGAGKILHDVIDIIPTTTLDIVKRQKGSTGIPEFSQAIRDKKIPLFRSGNIRFHEVAVNNINAKITDLYAQKSIHSHIVAAKYSGNGGIDVINELCQSLCNNDGQRIEFEQQGKLRHLNIKQGDPVIFIKNNYDRGVRNGTMGTVVLAGRSDVSAEGEFAVADIKIDGEERVIPLTMDLIDSVRVAYAVSLHKAQGSQFKRIIIPLVNARMVDNSWLYTAVTRAEIKIELVGSRKLFERLIMRDSAINKRDTYLKVLLIKEISKRS